MEKKKNNQEPVKGKYAGYKGIRKGEVRNPKGRGRTEGKVPTQIKEAYANFVSMQTERFTEWIDRIAQKDPYKAMSIIIELTPYVIPKLASQQIEMETTNVPTFDYSILKSDEIEFLISILQKIK